ncbi:MAG: PLU-1-like domain protein [Leptospiraceae bacterium]|nr:PLU-1-like domain protein [Leptospiraceae bacterium]MCP5510848.1 PLU-1-like domain protein [Leptospiraceae bacterium]
MVKETVKRKVSTLEKFPELESYFQSLTDTTDNIAIINTHYEADHEKDFQDLENIFQNIQSIEWETADNGYYNLFTSYFTFHVKIIEEIIKEAREILNPDKREYLKLLVTYKKNADDWFAKLKKKRKAVQAA